jgi:CHAT domain-containing protein/tetratricopeptide (TPR) repeat protein
MPCPVLFALVLVASPAQGPGPPATAIKLEEEMRRELPASPAFSLEVGVPGPITITLDSLDFDARIEVEAPKKGVVGRDEDSGDFTNARLVLDVAEPTSLTIRVAAQDGRAGEFVLLARAGRTDAPRGLEAARRDAACARSAAERARDRGEHARAARLFGVSSQASYTCGRIADARADATAECDEARAAGDPDLLLRATIDLGGAEQRLGNLARAGELLEGALGPARESLARASAAAEASSTAEKDAARILCFLCQSLGDLRKRTRGAREAIPYLREAIETAPRAGQPDFEPLLLGKLGALLDEAGEEEEAAEAIERAVEIARGLPNRPHVLVDALLQRAHHLDRHGRSDEARRCCEDALALPATRSRIELLGTLANLCLDLGRYERAQSALDELERLSRESGDGSFAIPNLQARSRIARRTGDLPRAQSLLEEALRLQEASGNAEHRTSICSDLGTVLDREEKFEESEQRFLQALESNRQIADRAEEVDLLRGLARVRERRGAYVLALSNFEEAAELAERLGDESSIETVRNGRAFVLYRLGRYEEARPLALAATAKLEELGVETALDARDTSARIGLATGDLVLVEESLCAADRFFGNQDAQSLGRYAAMGLRSSFANFGELAQDLAWAKLRIQTDPEAARSISRESWRDAGRWKGRILLEGMRGRGTDGAGPDAALRPRIGPKTALLEFVDGVDSLRAYVVVGEEVQLVDLGEKLMVEAAAHEFLQSLETRSADVESFARNASWLFERLVAPLLKRFPDGIDTLVVIPTAGLSGLPFEALVVAPISSGQTRSFADLRYLVDDFEVVYAPSAPVLAQLQKRPPVRREPRFLVAGDPIYRPEWLSAPDHAVIAASRPSESIVDLDRLRETREESLEIAALLLRGDPSASAEQKAELVDLGGSRSATLSSPRLDLRLGSQASVELFREDLRPYTHLHLAAHGHVDGGDPRHSGLVFSWEPQTQGFVPLEEVLGLDLDAELVVLSACDTASGPVVRGEGVQSLAHAFVEAGARSVLASLWKVYDVDAARVMKDFYGRHLGAGKRCSRALRESKLEFLKARRKRGLAVREASAEESACHPYCWAGFVLIGVPPG